MLVEALEPARDALFPKTFEYVAVEGGHRTTETRLLFGDLVEAVQDVEEYDEALPPPPRPPLATAAGAKLAAVATRPVNARRAAFLRTAAAA